MANGEGQLIVQDGERATDPRTYAGMRVMCVTSAIRVVIALQGNQISIERRPSLAIKAPGRKSVQRTIFAVCRSGGDAANKSGAAFT